MERSMRAGVKSMMEEARRTPPWPTPVVKKLLFPEVLLLPVLVGLLLSVGTSSFTIFVSAAVLLLFFKPPNQHIPPTMGVEGYTNDRQGWPAKPRRRPS